MPSPTRTIDIRHFAPIVLPALIAAFAVACGGESKPPAAKPAVSAGMPPASVPTTQPDAPPPPDPATPADAGPPPPPPPSQERPPVLMSSDKELSAAVSSSPGAKFELGDDTGRAIFRIREGALSSPHVFTFKVDPKAKTTGLAIGGRIYRLIVQIENSQTLPKVETSDKPFEFTMPTDKKKGVNLAIGEINIDGKGIEKITWTIVAPEKVDEEMGTAFFKVTAVGNYILHMTTKAPTAAK